MKYTWDKQNYQESVSDSESDEEGPSSNALTSAKMKKVKEHRTKKKLVLFFILFSVRSCMYLVAPFLLQSSSMLLNRLPKKTNDNSHNDNNNNSNKNNAHRVFLA